MYELFCLYLVVYAEFVYQIQIKKHAHGSLSCLMVIQWKVTEAEVKKTKLL